MVLLMHLETKQEEQRVFMDVLTPPNATIFAHCVSCLNKGISPEGDFHVTKNEVIARLRPMYM